MTTNKPEVFKFHCHGQFAPAYACNKPGDNSGEYVSLSDYEALAEECEKLRSIISDLKSWDCDVSGGFLSIPVDLRSRMQEAIVGAMQGDRP